VASGVPEPHWAETEETIASAAARLEKSTMLSTLGDFSEKWLLVGRFHGYQKGDGETTYIN
jgi:hypothetical protein